MFARPAALVVLFALTLFAVAAEESADSNWPQLVKIINRFQMRG